MKNGLYNITNKVRRLRKNDRLPYNLLLLADESIEVIDKYIKDCEIYILEIDDQIIAVYALQNINIDEIEIKNIAVDKNFQGNGIGKFLLKDASVKAKNKGFKSILIGTADVAIKQLNLYQKEGFEIFKIKKDFFIQNYPEPIYENGLLLKDMIILKKNLI